MAQADFSFLPFGAGGIPANENSGTSLAAPRWYYGTAVPTVGTFNKGDIIFNVNQSVGQPLGWFCYTATTSSSVGSFASFGAISAPLPTQTTTATSGTLTGNYSMTLLNPASTGTYSLPDAAANFAGFRSTFKNIASGSTTLTPLGSNGYADAAAITLAQYASATLLSVGGTTWYRAQ